MVRPFSGNILYEVDRIIVEMVEPGSAVYAFRDQCIVSDHWVVMHHRFASIGLTDSYFIDIVFSGFDHLCLDPSS